MKQKTLWLVIVALSAIGWAGWKFFPQSKKIQWRSVAVERGTVRLSITTTGTLQAKITVQVGTQVSGTVSALLADFNSQVKKGQVIARIDTTLLRASFEDAQSALARNQAQARQTSEELKRSQALFQRALVSQAELDQTTANAQIASANLNSTRAQLERARINLRYATIVSPIDGIVLSRAVDVGQTVAASFNTPTLFTIAGDLTQMQALAAVDEADIGKIKAGQIVSFTVDAYPDTTFSGTVRQVRLQPKTEQNVVTYDVVIEAANPHLRLMPGMTANLSIILTEKENVLWIPTTALRFQPPRTKNKPSDTAHRSNSKQGQQRIFLLVNHMPQPVYVTVGLNDGTRCEIQSGIEEGAKVLTGMDSSEKQKTTGTPFGMPTRPTGGGGGRRN